MGKPVHTTFHSGVSTLLILALAAVGLSSARMTQKLKVGDPQISGSFLKPYKNVWRLTYSKPGREPLDAAVWSDALEIVQGQGRTLMKRTQVATYKQRALTTRSVNIFDPQTLAPVAMDFERSDNGAFNHREFKGATVTYRRAASATEEVHQGEVRFDAPVFDFYGGMWGLLLASCPLKEGYTATFPSIAEDDETLRWATFEVEGKEMVEAGAGKKVLAWIVKTDDHGPMTFWLTKEPPYVIKLVYVTPGGVTATYTMV